MEYTRRGRKSAEVLQGRLQATAWHGLCALTCRHAWQHPPETPEAQGSLLSQEPGMPRHSWPDSASNSLMSLRLQLMTCVGQV